MSLYAEYFVLTSGISGLEEIDFSSTPSESGVVDMLDAFDSSGSLWDGGPSDDFAARYTGNLNVVEGGTYTLYLTSDDGSALYIDG
ncbi:MAG: PA14 domain-containing protein, partial [Kordiimonas sp.]